MPTLHANRSSAAESEILPRCINREEALQSCDDGPKAIIGGIVTSLATRQDIAEIMRNDVLRLRAGTLPQARIVTASNGYVIATYHSSPPFRRLIDDADLVDADGMSLVFVSRLFLHKPLLERAATTDFIEDACAMAVRHGISFYFLGAEEGVAAKAADNLASRYPGLRIAGVRNGYFTDDQLDAVCANIMASKAEIVWLGLGSPRQEEIACALQKRLSGVAWVRTCGGLFDHCSGKRRRASKLMQKLGMEWLHRAILEPGRLGRRYAITNPIALYHLLTKTRDI